MAKEEFLKKSEWIPYVDDNMAAIQTIRKVVYRLATVFNEEAVKRLMIEINLDYIDYSSLEGSSTKQKIVALLCLCQEKGLLNQFLKEFANMDIALDASSIDNIQTRLKANLHYLSFDIPSDSTCVFIKKYSESYHEDIHSNQVYLDAKHPCRLFYICEICGKQTRTEYEHDWGDWEYINEKECTKIRKCNKCHEKEHLYEQHIWIETKNKNGSSYKICNHCHHEKFNICGKWHGMVNWNNGNQDIWYVTIEKKGIFRKLKATINIYVGIYDAPEGKRCQYKICQECNVSINGKTCVIEGKKLKDKPKNTLYSLDTFEGIIVGPCSYIDGDVHDENMSGILKLEPES